MLSLLEENCCQIFVGRILAPDLFAFATAPKTVIVLDNVNVVLTFASLFSKEGDRQPLNIDLLAHHDVGTPLDCLYGQSDRGLDFERCKSFST